MAAVAWLLAVALSGTVFFVLIIATVLALIYTVVRGDKAGMGIWGLIAIAWALVLAEKLGGQRERRHHRRRRRVARRRARRPPGGDRQEVDGAAALSADLAGDRDRRGRRASLDPWGVSWLWVAAVLGPVLGLRTVLNPSPRDHGTKQAARADRPAGWFVASSRVLTRPSRLAGGAAAPSILARVAFGLRVWSLGHGLPYAYNLDERAHFVPHAVAMTGGDLNPGYFINPPFLTYILAAWLSVVHLGGVEQWFADDAGRGVPRGPLDRGVLRRRDGRGRPTRPGGRGSTGAPGWSPPR